MSRSLAPPGQTAHAHHQAARQAHACYLHCCPPYQRWILPQPDQPLPKKKAYPNDDRRQALHRAEVPPAFPSPCSQQWPPLLRRFAEDGSEMPPARTKNEPLSARPRKKPAITRQFDLGGNGAHACSLLFGNEPINK